MTKAVRPSGDLAEEKIALARIYLYRDDIIYISSTVREEYEKITNEEIRRNHQGIDDILLGDIPTSESQIIESRMLEYCKHHSGKKKDCKILAEAELSGCQILLTYDQDFLKRLRSKTHSINMLEPSEYWQVRDPSPTPFSNLKSVDLSHGFFLCAPIMCTTGSPSPYHPPTADHPWGKPYKPMRKRTSHTSTLKGISLFWYRGNIFILT
jgi:predicted nucleic acid-binding protein